MATIAPIAIRAPSSPMTTIAALTAMASVSCPLMPPHTQVATGQESVGRQPPAGKDLLMDPAEL